MTYFRKSEMSLSLSYRYTAVSHSLIKKKHQKIVHDFNDIGVDVEDVPDPART
jgi:hypothetical protein